MVGTLSGVCSNKPHAITQNNHSKGSQYWKREVWHVRSAEFKKTLCGRNCTDWLDIGKIPPTPDLCIRCATKSGLSDAKGKKP